MKTVFNSHGQLAHVWAQNEQAYGRASNMFFKNGTIYSYGYHFAIAKHTKDKHRKPCILFTVKEYSISTSGHKSHVRQAIAPGARVFYVSDPQAETQHCHKLNAEGILHKAHSCIDQAAKRRKASLALSDIAEAREYYNQRNEYARAFIKNARDIKFPEIDLDAIKAKAKKQKEKEINAAKNRVKNLVKNTVEVHGKPSNWVKKWQNHEIRTLNVHGQVPCRDRDGLKVYLKEKYGFDAEKVYLRVSKNREEIQTSKNAGVPYPHAKKLALRIKHQKELGEQWRPGFESIRVGHFSVNRIDANGDLTAGCHFIQWDEIEELANREGWF